MHLTDCFVELLSYVLHFRKTVDRRQPPYEQVKADIMRLLSQGEASVRDGAFSQEDYDQARFMICAWVDEVILRSSWTHKNLWQREQLQRVYYNTTDAGEEVFDRLNALGFHQRAVREVYYLCLALGFVGRYCNKGDDYLLDQLRTSNLKLLTNSSVGLPSLERTELFPEAYPAGNVALGQPKARSRFSLFTLLWLIGPVIFFGLLFLVYRFTLHGVGESLLAMGS
jgi:type VI secretion system protein ImpK